MTHTAKPFQQRGRIVEDVVVEIKFYKETRFQPYSSNNIYKKITVQRRAGPRDLKALSEIMRWDGVEP